MLHSKTEQTAMLTTEYRCMQARFCALVNRIEIQVQLLIWFILFWGSLFYNSAAFLNFLLEAQIIHDKQKHLSLSFGTLVKALPKTGSAYNCSSVMKHASSSLDIAVWTAPEKSQRPRILWWSSLAPYTLSVPIPDACSAADSIHRSENPSHIYANAIITAIQSHAEFAQLIHQLRHLSLLRFPRASHRHLNILMILSLQLSLHIGRIHDVAIIPLAALPYVRLTHNLVLFKSKDISWGLYAVSCCHLPFLVYSPLALRGYDVAQSFTSCEIWQSPTMDWLYRNGFLRVSRFPFLLNLDPSLVRTSMPNGSISCFGQTQQLEIIHIAPV